MEGLVTAAAAAAHGATTHAPPPGITFTYTPADIQGLAAEPRGGGGIQVAAQPPHHGHPGSPHLVQGRQGLPQQASSRMHGGSAGGIGMSGGAGGRTSESEKLHCPPEKASLKLS